MRCKEDIMTEKEKEIKDLLNKLTSQMLKSTTNEGVYDKRISFLTWINKKAKLQSSAAPSVVKQKEIFFCELGVNIGSEQGGKRPVVIMQNDIGNSYGNTTIVVPITTYENSTFYTKDGKQYMSYTNSDGNAIERSLDFYEIPISIEDGYRHEIHGIANVVHMREVSKKRLSNTPVAKITNETYNAIVQAIQKNIGVF